MLNNLIIIKRLYMLNSSFVENMWVGLSSIVIDNFLHIRRSCLIGSSLKIIFFILPVFACFIVRSSFFKHLIPRWRGWVVVTGSPAGPPPAASLPAATPGCQPLSRVSEDHLPPPNSITGTTTKRYCRIRSVFFRIPIPNQNKRGLDLPR